MSILEPYRDVTRSARSQPVRLAQLMDLPKPLQMNDLRLADAVETGLPVRTFDAIALALAPFGKAAMNTVVSESTYRRAQKSAPRRLSRDASERVYDLARVLDETLGLYRGDQESVFTFLTTRHQLLEGRTPFDVARSSSAGANVVLDIVRQARAGVAI